MKCALYVGYHDIVACLFRATANAVERYPAYVTNETQIVMPIRVVSTARNMAFTVSENPRLICENEAFC